MIIRKEEKNVCLPKHLAVRDDIKEKKNACLPKHLAVT